MKAKHVNANVRIFKALDVICLGWSLHLSGVAVVLVGQHPLSRPSHVPAALRQGLARHYHLWASLPQQGLQFGHLDGTVDIPVRGIQSQDTFLPRHLAKQPKL